MAALERGEEEATQGIIVHDIHIWVHVVVPEGCDHIGFVEHRELAVAVEWTLGGTRPSATLAAAAHALAAARAALALCAPLGGLALALLLDLDQTRRGPIRHLGLKP